MNSFLAGEAYQRHELSSVFGDMPDEDFVKLKSNIQLNGVIEKTIVTLDGDILDGWHRYRAVRELDIDGELSFVEFDGSDPVKFVLAKNLHRRHLPESQRAVVTAEANKWRDEGRPKLSEKTLPVGRVIPKSTAEMADEAGVGVRTMSRARQVIKDAPDLVDDVKSGDLSLRAAERKIKERKYVEAMEDSGDAESSDVPEEPVDTTLDAFEDSSVEDPSDFKMDAPISAVEEEVEDVVDDEEDVPEELPDPPAFNVRVPLNVAQVHNALEHLKVHKRTLQFADASLEDKEDAITDVKRLNHANSPHVREVMGDRDREYQSFYSGIFEMFLAFVENLRDQQLGYEKVIRRLKEEQNAE